MQNKLSHLKNSFSQSYEINVLYTMIPTDIHSKQILHKHQQDKLYHLGGKALDWRE